MGKGPGRIAACMITAMTLLLAACSGSEGEASDVYGVQATKQTETQNAGDEEGVFFSDVKSEDGSEESSSADPAADPQRTTNANFGDCSRMFPAGAPPRIVAKEYAAAMKPTYEERCYRAFAIGHSGRTRTALWSAEVLTKASLELAYGVSRVDAFEEDESLPAEHRSQLTDYRGSGYDRGHLAPSADMPSREAQKESFLLSNIVPQNGRMNGGVWRDLESDVRKEAKKRKVYIVTGPLFQNSREALKKRVLVPTAMYKAMFSVGKGAVVFVVSNDDNAKVQTLSINQFIQIYGLDPFPGLTGPIRTHNIALAPLPNAGKVATAENDGTSSGEKKSECTKTRLAKAEGTALWYNEKQFKKVHGRAPRANEWSKC